MVSHLPPGASDSTLTYKVLAETEVLPIWLKVYLLTRTKILSRLYTTL